MLYVDSHVHIGDASLVEKYITTSEYRDKIRLYSAIDSECVKMQEEYLQECYKYFGIPIILKEINIYSANRYLEEFSLTHKDCVPVFLVGDDISIYYRNKARILKEHFLHHKADKWRDRSTSYEYLNNIGGYLLIHSSDSIRIEYITMLRKLFPNMKIIIAHMGRNIYEYYTFSKKVIDTFKHEENIFVDTSTIRNHEILLYAYKKFGDERILFGTDFPYECHKTWKIEEFFNPLNMIKIPEKSMVKIILSNALRIMEEC